MKDDATNNKGERLVVLALAAVFSCALILGGVWLGTTLQLRLFKSETVKIGGPFTLTATDGKKVSDRTYRGKWVLIYFGYTYCPDACPTALNSISMALEKFGSDTGTLQPLFVTVDPQRDTREVMSDYLKPLPELWALLEPKRRSMM